MLKPHLKEIKFIAGTVGAGKSTKLLDEYCNISKKHKSAFISFEENLSIRIPPENIDATVNYIVHDGKTMSIDEFVAKMNSFIDRENLEYLFLDTIGMGLNHPYDDITLFKMATKIKSSVYITTQLTRDGAFKC